MWEAAGFSFQTNLNYFSDVLYVHLEDPFCFPSIAIDLFLSAKLCVISRSLVWEWEAGMYVQLTLMIQSLQVHCGNTVFSLPESSSIKIQLGLLWGLGGQNRLNSGEFISLQY